MGSDTICECNCLKSEHSDDGPCYNCPECDYFKEKSKYLLMLAELMKKHHMGRMMDPGGAELTHPRGGSVRISEMPGSERNDYYELLAFLRHRGYEKILP